MSFEEEQDALILEILTNHPKTRYEYQDLQALIGSITGDGLQIAIDRLLSNGVLVNSKFVPDGYELKTENVVHGYSLTSVGRSRLRSLKRKRKNEVTETILLWVAAFAGLIAAVASIIMPVVTSKSTTTQQQTTTSKRVLPTAAPHRTLRPDTTKVRNKDSL